MIPVESLYYFLLATRHADVHLKDMARVVSTHLSSRHTASSPSMASNSSRLMASNNSHNMALVMLMVPQRHMVNSHPTERRSPTTSRPPASQATAAALLPASPATAVLLRMASGLAATAGIARLHPCRPTPTHRLKAARTVLLCQTSGCPSTRTSFSVGTSSRPPVARCGKLRRTCRRSHPCPRTETTHPAPARALLAVPTMARLPAHLLAHTLVDTEVATVVISSSKLLLPRRTTISVT